MIEGIFILIELLAMLFLLLKVSKKQPASGDESLGIFDYIKERPQEDNLKSKGQPRA